MRKIDTFSSDYGATESVSKIISFIGWIFAWAGVIIVIVGLLNSDEFGGVFLLTIIPGLGTSVSGLFLVIAGQITRATINNANSTKEILNTIYEFLEVKEIKNIKTQTLKKHAILPGENPYSLLYKDIRIKHDNNIFWVEERKFGSMAEAKKYIDE